VFDPPTPTFRHKIFEAYKANRDETPEDIRKSVPYIKQIIEKFNIPIIQVDGYEADDVIGAIAKKVEKEDFQVYMMTPDKDYAQLLSDNIFMYKPKRFGNEAEVVTVEKICEKYHITDPIQVIDILALWGDSADNIPGAPGIGEKTSQKLISKYGSVENVYKNIDDLKGKQKENLINFKEQIELSKFLVTIKLDIDYGTKSEEFKIVEPDEKGLTELFTDLEFNTITKRLFNKVVVSKNENTPLQTSLFDEQIIVDKKFDDINSVNHKYVLVDNAELRNELILKLKQQKEFCFDTETTGLKIYDLELVGISFSWEQHKAYYVPLPENRNEVIKILADFKDVFSDKSVRKIGQNIKFDIMVLNTYDIEIAGSLFDTMIAHYVLQPEFKHNLDYLSNQYLNYSPVSIEKLIGKGKNQISMREVPIETIKEYACEDADLTFLLKEKLEKELVKAKFTDLAENIEFPLIYVLAEMELNGVKIDREALNKYSKQLTKELIKIEKKIHELSGEIFNISSPKQLGEILFDKLKIVEKAKKTKTKQYSTSEDTLLKLKDKHPIINEILEFRSVKKLLSTYVDALPLLINSKTGRIHASFNQAVTSTGRLSSSNPNLQNIPIRDERGKEIRKAVIPYSEEHTLLAADYSQVELRLMAHISRDEHMIKAFKNNVDIHATTAAKIFHLKNIDEVTSEQRRIAKTANFGIIYGISAFGLAQRLEISRTEAKTFIDDYFLGFPKVKEYMDNTIASARNKIYVETLMGRKRFLNDINSRNGTVRSFAERNAINAPIQGSAADVIKLAMCDLHYEMKMRKVKSKMILQVHDELVFDVPNNELELMKELIKEKMENAVKLSVPLTVDIGVGKNWIEAH
ncbi:MAG: DNA polymerase I, partial [Bacteroidota bacterium]|nr:DNA polymerase I [Bacteroidota bacterium]